MFIPGLLQCFVSKGLYTDFVHFLLSLKSISKTDVSLTKLDAESRTFRLWRIAFIRISHFLASFIRNIESFNVVFGNDPPESCHYLGEVLHVHLAFELFVEIIVFIDIEFIFIPVLAETHHEFCELLAKVSDCLPFIFL